MLPFYLAANESLARVDVSMLPDQTLMELFIADFDDSFKAQFYAANGDFRDVCTWQSIFCDDAGDIFEIHWCGCAQCDVFLPGGSISLDALPQNLQILRLRSRNHNLTGTLSASALPQSLRCFLLEDTLFHGTVDFTAFPERLEALCLVNCLFEGAANLERLPAGLEILALTGQKFDGTVNLTRLPEALLVLYLMENNFYGLPNLEALPARLRAIVLTKNNFEGPVSLCDLPRTLTILELGENHFCGEVDFQRLPASLETIDLSDNLFTGSVDLELLPESLKRIQLRGNRFQGSVDPHNIPAGTLEEPQLTFDFTENFIQGPCTNDEAWHCADDLEKQKGDEQGFFFRSSVHQARFEMSLIACFETLLRAAFLVWAVWVVIF